MLEIVHVEHSRIGHAQTHPNGPLFRCFSQTSSIGSRLCHLGDFFVGNANTLTCSSAPLQTPRYVSADRPLTYTARRTHAKALLLMLYITYEMISRFELAIQKCGVL